MRFLLYAARHIASACLPDLPSAADVFGGQMMSCIRCHACAFRSLCFDPFLDLSLPIPKARPSTLLRGGCAL
jgi:ubiquitin C-terminal hydrolase